MVDKITLEFLSICKRYYEQKKMPTTNGKFSLSEDDPLVKIANVFFKEMDESKFVGFFWESQFNVNLWASHLVVECDVFSKENKEEAFKIIKRYAKSPLNELLAKEESLWLRENYSEH